MSGGDWGVEAVEPTEFQTWVQPPSPTAPILDDLPDVFNFNALADVPDLPNLGTDIGHEFVGADFALGAEQFSADTLFDFSAFDPDPTGDLSLEASQPTPCLQSQNGAPTIGSDRQGFAASG